MAGNDEYTDDALGITTTESPPETETTPPQEAAAEAASVVEERLYAGKYKSVDELERGYKEVERAMHASRQPAPEPEPEPQFDPFAQMPGIPESFWQAAAQNPQETLAWAIQNRDKLGFPSQADQVVNTLFQAWQAQAPIDAAKWVAQAEIEQRVNERMAELAPMQEQAIESTMDVAVFRATQELPDFGVYKDEVSAYLAQYNQQGQLDAWLAQNPRADNVFGLLQQAYYTIVGSKTTEQRRADAVAAAQEPAAKATTRTQTRASASKPSADGSDDLFPPDTFRTPEQRGYDPAASRR